MATLIADKFEAWKAEANARFDQLKANEEELNRIFAEIYDMVGEVPIEVEDKYVSVARVFDTADEIPESFKGNKYVRTRRDDIVSLLSYAVGCIFGRYSLDVDGLVLADAGATVADYLAKVPEPSFAPDGDNIVPVLDGEWFDDDIVMQVYRFLAAAYGEETLDANVAYIEDALGSDLRTYFVKEFYKDHVKTYKKRPIYWMFQSPKKGFSCLVYLHRYNPSTVGEVLGKYVRPYRTKLEQRAEVLGQSSRAADVKAADKMRARVKELEDWERDVMYDLAHARVELDLDDGVKVNYNKFPHALAKVTGLSDWK